MYTRTRTLVRPLRNKQSSSHLTRSSAAKVEVHPKSTLPGPIGCELTVSRSGTRLIVTESDWSFITLLSVIGGLVIGSSLALYHKQTGGLESTLSKEFEVSQAKEETRIMVTGSLPGRPGNLTNDQEAKLRELWKASLKVFGVSQQGGSAATNGVKEGDSVPSKEGAQDAHAAIVGSEKKKKKRINMFGRKKDDGTGDEDAGTDHPEMAKDPEDKYGQTKEFHKAIATSTPEELRTAFWGMVKHDHPDGLLLRFLRARKWDVQKALVMMVSTMHWRMAEMHVDDDIIKHGEAAALDDSRSSDKAVSKEGSDFLMQMRLGKSYLHGTDKEGRPMCFVNVRLHKQGDQSEHSLERYTVYLLETARLFLEPPVDTAVSIPVSDLITRN